MESEKKGGAVETGGRGEEPVPVRGREGEGVQSAKRLTIYGGKKRRGNARRKKAKLPQKKKDLGRARKSGPLRVREESLLKKGEKSVKREQDQAGRLPIPS